MTHVLFNRLGSNQTSKSDDNFNATKLLNPNRSKQEFHSKSTVILSPFKESITWLYQSITTLEMYFS